MPTRADELDAFKTRINLSEYAASCGYAVDRRASSRNSVAMKHDDGDKIIIGMGGDQHWTFYSVRDPADNGSIIDFIQNRQRVTLGEVRKLLRPWLDGVASATPLPCRPPASAFVDRVEPVVVDIPAVRDRLAGMQSIAGHHAYLVDERAIPMKIITSDRMAGRVLRDDRGNVVFPHWNKYGYCGYEIKNSGFTGFSKHGMKGLWAVGKKDEDHRMVIGESALDAMSYAALFGFEGTRLVSTAGAMNPHQPALLRQAMANMPAGSQIIAAVDHDEGGDAMAEHLEVIYLALRRTDIAFKRHSPLSTGEDWNDSVRASVAKAEPFPGMG